MHSIIQFENVGLLDLETQILNLNGKPTTQLLYLQNRCENLRFFDKWKKMTHFLETTYLVF